MERLGKAAALFLFGVFMHSTAPFIDALPKGWGALTRNAIGFLMCWLGILPFAKDYADTPDPFTRISLQFFTGNIPMGLGVVSAYIFGHYISQHESDK